MKYNLVNMLLPTPYSVLYTVSHVFTCARAKLFDPIQRDLAVPACFVQITALETKWVEGLLCAYPQMEPRPAESAAYKAL
jgi:hypothetical protein